MSANKHKSPFEEEQEEDEQSEAPIYPPETIMDVYMPDTAPAAAIRATTSASPANSAPGARLASKRSEKQATPAADKKRMSGQQSRGDSADGSMSPAASQSASFPSDKPSQEQSNDDGSNQETRDTRKRPGLVTEQQSPKRVNVGAASDNQDQGHEHASSVDSGRYTRSAYPSLWTAFEDGHSHCGVRIATKLDRPCH